MEHRECETWGHIVAKVLSCSLIICELLFEGKISPVFTLGVLFFNLLTVIARHGAYEAYAILILDMPSQPVAEA